MPERAISDIINDLRHAGTWKVGEEEHRAIPDRDARVLIDLFDNAAPMQFEGHYHGV